MIRAIIFITILMSHFCQAIAWNIVLSADGEGEKSISVKTVSLDDEGRQVLFLAIEAPGGTDKAEQLVQDQWVPLKVHNFKGKNYLLLTESQGEFRVDGKSSKYKLNGENNFFKVAKNCDQLKLKTKTISKSPSRFPAVLNCVWEDKKIKEVIFSTTGDSEWFGAGGAFESAGKGERWKVFSWKDIATFPRWEIKWGSEAEPNQQAFLIPQPPGSKTPKPIIPSFKFTVGLQYVSGNLTRTAESSKASGVQIPVGVVYQPEKAWWFLGANYEFFALSASKVTGGSNSISGFSFNGGLDLGIGSTGFMKFNLGYRNRNIDAPGVRLSSTFDAPQVGVEFGFLGQQNGLGVFAQQAQTSGEGKYSELNAGIYYQSPLLFNHWTRFTLATNKLKASVSSIDFSAQWISLGFGVQF